MNVMYVHFQVKILSFFPILADVELCRQILVKIPNMDWSENPPGGRRAALYRRDYDNSHFFASALRTRLEHGASVNRVECYYVSTRLHGFIFQVTVTFKFKF
jgi:hypothetical protein